MRRLIAALLVQLATATVAAFGAILLSLVLMWFAAPWFLWMLNAAGVSWETSRISPEGFVIVPVAIALAAYLCVLALWPRHTIRRCAN
jgi:hypothetical protein